MRDRLNMRILTVMYILRSILKLYKKIIMVYILKQLRKKRD